LIGQGKIAATIDRLRPNGLTGRAYWIAGPSGLGKTTAARLIAAEVTGNNEWAVAEVDATTMTPQDVEALVRKTWGRPMFGAAWAVIINEAHGMNRATLRRFLTVFDNPSCTVAWIFTTTCERPTKKKKGAVEEDAPKIYKSKDGGALLSRCCELPLNKQGVAVPLARRAKEIAVIEHLDGKPIEAYIRLVNVCHSNMRMTLQRIGEGEMLA